MSTAAVLQPSPVFDGSKIACAGPGIGGSVDELATNNDIPSFNGTVNHEQYNEQEPNAEANIATTETSASRKRIAPATPPMTPSQPAKKRVTAKNTTPSTTIDAEDAEINSAAEVLLAVAEPATPKTKKSPTKPKKTKSPSKTAEEWDAEPSPSSSSSFSSSASATTIATASQDGEGATAAVKSPRKKGPASSPKNKKKSNVGGAENLTAQGNPRKRSSVKGEWATPRGIPKSWDEAGEADRMLFAMKEEGKDWASIRAAWKVITGEETGASSLPNRYNRIKCNMLRLKDGDGVRLFTAKTQVERDFETSKWALIAGVMVQKGGDDYPVEFLKKQWKELEAKGGLNALEAKADEDEVGDGLHHSNGSEEVKMEGEGEERCGDVA
ncbi:MAG: hypothetical protein Q9163_001878 [Psora crenata]